MWRLGVVGLTDQWVHQRINGKDYEDQVRFYTSEINRLVEESSSEKISLEKEYRFVLMRYWTLYDSLYHSAYVASRLSTWKPDGQKQLELLLAKMGISIQQSKQTFTAMNFEVKQNLYLNIKKHGPKFGLKDICFPSFIKQEEFKLDQSAVDTVYALSSLLEIGISTQDNKFDWEKNFWEAYDALNPGKKDNLLRKGIEISIKTQKAVVRMASFLVEKKLLVKLGTFRYCFLKESSDLSYFHHPLTLTKLAQFLNECLTERGQQVLPLCLFALNPEKEVFLVVGFSNQEKRKNSFGVRLHEAALSANATIRNHSFDSCVFEIDKHSVDSFVEQLSARCL